MRSAGSGVWRVLAVAVMAAAGGAAGVFALTTRDQSSAATTALVGVGG